MICEFSPATTWMRIRKGNNIEAPVTTGGSKALSAWLLKSCAAFSILCLGVASVGQMGTPTPLSNIGGYYRFDRDPLRSLIEPRGQVHSRVDERWSCADRL